MSTDVVAGPPRAVNEAVRPYAPGSRERVLLEAELERIAGDRLEIPLVIGGKDVQTGELRQVVMPHAKEHTLADVHQAGPNEANRAIAAAEEAWHDWHHMPWEDRSAIFLRAARLLSQSPWREVLNAATMLGQSKTANEADLDAACEVIDFWRFNVEFMLRVYREQPESAQNEWNRIDYRPLEGFVLAISPFNFTALGANLSCAPALMGNTVVWKPASTAAVSAHYLMRLLQQAGLPDGVINLIHAPGSLIGEHALTSEHLAAVHFTGSTEVFQDIWDRVGRNIRRYRNYPRLVGETGGKDFIVAHPSSDLDSLATAILRGAFEYQGQKCSAASRLYIPSNLWPQLQDKLVDEMQTIRVGDIRDFRNFMGAVIDGDALRKHARAIAEARSHDETEIIAGGHCSEEVGYFVEPTLIVTQDPQFRLLRDELFGPILTAYVYPERQFEQTLALIERTSPFALTGAVFANDRLALQQAMRALRYAAGNIYVNDKPTGSVVGRQPFGGSRASGTNDKAGSIWHLIRWATPRTIKERFDAPSGYRYPFMDGVQADA